MDYAADETDHRDYCVLVFAIFAVDLIVLDTITVLNRIFEN